MKTGLDRNGTKQDMELEDTEKQGDDSDTPMIHARNWTDMWSSTRRGQNEIQNTARRRSQRMKSKVESGSQL